jgi:hypothetical protein
MKKRNKLDMYILFAMLAMIMSDDLERYKDDKMQLTDIIKAEKTKKVVALGDVVDAFRVIYENVHPQHYPVQDKEVHETNKLLNNLINFDSYTMSNQIVEGNEGGPDELGGFVVEDKEKMLRMGSKVGRKWF